MTHSFPTRRASDRQLLFCRWRIVDDPIISGIIGIAAQECLCEPGEIEIGPLVCRTFAIVSHGFPRRNRGGASGVVRPLNIPTPCGGRPKKWGGPPARSGGTGALTQRSAAPGGASTDRIHQPSLPK